MSIEFPCPQCGRTLRTPDGSSGKKAKCPSCESVAVIPAASDGGLDDFPDLAPAAEAPPSNSPFGQSPAAAGNPFADGSSGGSGSTGGFNDAPNPYASPHAEGFYDGGVGKSPLQHRKIDFGDVLSTTWSILSANMGNMILLTLMLLGFAIGAYIIFFVGIIAGSAVAIGLQGGQPNPEPSVALYASIAIGGGVVAIGMMFAFGWLGAGITKYLTAVARGHASSLSDVFSGQRYMMRMTGNIFITQVILAQGLTYLGMAPGFFAENEGLQVVGQLSGQLIGGIVNAFFLPLAAYFIVDRDASLMESYSMSIKYLGGNRLSLFALYIVVGIVGGLAVLVTCGFGLLLYVPYYMLFMTVVYLISTGQTVQR